MIGIPWIDDSLPTTPPFAKKEMPTPDPPKPVSQDAYWKSNLKVVIPLLLIWFLVGYVVSILLIVPLNNLSIGRLGLGFWMAQQGSIFVFVAIVWFYAVWMGRVDKQHSIYPSGNSDEAGEGTK